jgi:hypothetical protein
MFFIALPLIVNTYKNLAIKIGIIGEKCTVRSLQAGNKGFTISID